MPTFHGIIPMVPSIANLMPTVETHTLSNVWTKEAGPETVGELAGFLGTLERNATRTLIVTEDPIAMLFIAMDQVPEVLIPSWSQDWKSLILNFPGIFPKFLRWIFRYCRCDPGTEQLYPGFRNAENNIESQKVMAVLNADTTDLIATRKRRSLERQSDALTSIMGYEKFKKTCNSYSSKYFGLWAFSVGASFCPDDSIRIYKKIYVNFWKL